MSQTLLLIDDDELTRTMLSMILEEDGWTVLSADGGSSALALIEQGSAVDVVLSDLQMPGISGPELVKALRTRLPAAKLLGMTATIKSNDIYGFDALLEKPLDADAVRSALRYSNAPEHAPSRIESGDADLDDATWQKLFAQMPLQQLQTLFQFALDDATARVEKMRAAVSAEDDAALQAQAHALKGSAGMIGATRLQRRASKLEGIGISSNTAAALDEIVLLIARLRSMLAERIATS